MKPIYLCLVAGILLALAGSAQAKSQDPLPKLLETVTPAEQEHLFMTYNAHNMITVVESVQDDIESAIETCGTENPDMKEGLDTRLATWNEALTPVLKDAKKQRDAMITEQGYTPQKNLKAIFKDLDDKREESQKKVEKNPVSTPEACKFLLHKMDETQDSMVKLLNNVLVVYPQKQTEKMKEEQAGAEAEDAPAENAAEEPAE